LIIKEGMQIKKMNRCREECFERRWGIYKEEIRKKEEEK